MCRRVVSFSKRLLRRSKHASFFTFIEYLVLIRAATRRQRPIEWSNSLSTPSSSMVSPAGDQRISSSALLSTSSSVPCADLIGQVAGRERRTFEEIALAGGQRGVEAGLVEDA